MIYNIFLCPNVRIVKFHSSISDRHVRSECSLRSVCEAKYFLRIVKYFLRIVKSHSSVSDRHVRSECSLRSVCEANHAASLRGDAARNSAEVGTYIMMSYLPLQFPVLQEMAMAARVGRLLANGKYK